MHPEVEVSQMLHLHQEALPPRPKDPPGSLLAARQILDGKVRVLDQLIHGRGEHGVLGADPPPQQGNQALALGQRQGQALEPGLGLLEGKHALAAPPPPREGQVDVWQLQ